jgi:glycosyltransferase involved in cell wall biosynthesis
MWRHTAPAASIVIATYNRPQVLRYAIRSVLQSTFEDWELIVVGDGCTDGTEALARSFGDARISWHSLPENSGNQAAPNNAGAGSTATSSGPGSGFRSRPASSRR